MGQLLQMQMHEWEPLIEAYAAYSSAIPGKDNPQIESVPEELEKLIKQQLSNAAFYRVYHPHPVNLNSLFEEIRAAIQVG